MASDDQRDLGGWYTDEGTTAIGAGDAGRLGKRTTDTRTGSGAGVTGTYAEPQMTHMPVMLQSQGAAIADSLQHSEQAKLSVVTSVPKATSKTAARRFISLGAE